MCIHKVSLNLFIIYTGVKMEEKRASPQGKTYSIMYIDLLNLTFRMIDNLISDPMKEI